MSILHENLKQYIAFRRALGAKLQEPARTLGYFVKFLEQEGAEFITLERALRWAMIPKLVQRATWARRLGMVRLFACWLSAIDPRTEVPPRRMLPGRRRRNKPHIFSQKEIAQLMEKAGRIHSPTGLRALTYATLIGLLSCTGLRPGEALALNRADVDMQSGILSIRDKKFGKSRFVPLDESTKIALGRYAKRRDKLCATPTTDAFLISEAGRRLEGGNARRTFAKLSVTVGLRVQTGRLRFGQGPRLQDFRHSFATRRLIDWYRSGLDVGRELPKLTAYLGHASIASTYWYLEAVPELLQLAADRISNRKIGGGK